MLWVKAFHVIAMVCWFAGLFYLPRLFVYHSMSQDAESNERFKIMERKLYRGIMNPSMVATVALGIWLLSYSVTGYLSMGWMHVKLLLVVILIAYHSYCGRLMRQFQADSNQHGHVFYRWFNEFPVLVLIAIIVLAIVKPF